MMEWWNNILFAQQWVLWLLPIVPALGIFIYFFGGKNKPALTLSSFRYLQGIAIPTKVKWRNILHVFRLLTLFLLIVAFARPQSRSGFKRKKGEGIDIMLAIDVSQSMEGTDIAPTRMEAAKQEAMRFVDERPDDRIGVVVFSGEGFSVCPLTSDHDALKILISNISTNDGQLEAGTAIGVGLAKAIERIRSSKAKSKVVVLITDGANNIWTTPPLDAGKAAKAFDVRVYTIGLGAAKGKVLIPTLQNPDGSYVMQYQDVEIDESTLMEISTMTNGKYFRASDNRKLEQIYSEINKLEKSEFDRTGTEQRKDEFLPFLLFALGFVLLEFVFRYTLFDSLT